MIFLFPPILKEAKRKKKMPVIIKRADTETRQVRCLPCFYVMHAHIRAISLLPCGTQHSEVALVSPLCVLLGGGEEFVGLLRELLFCYGSEADFTL